ncbi:MAG: hypothetical protein J6V49_06345, partial [Bacteroidales bacterium]|nr:hypothetical protein [Bacteroidales bacterium]
NTAVTKEIDDDDADGDELLAININHNTFRNATPSEDSHKLIAMETVQVFDTASVVVNNNLFYNTGAAVLNCSMLPNSTNTSRWMVKQKYAIPFTSVLI